jgi:hypothetical protein
LKFFCPLRTTKGSVSMPGSMREVRQDLSRRFGGITTFTRAPAHGTSEARGEIVHDDIVVFEVMTDTVDRPWWEAYRHRIEQSFARDEIVIRAVAITRL